MKKDGGKFVLNLNHFSIIFSSELVKFRYRVLEDRSSMNFKAKFLGNLASKLFEGISLSIKFSSNFEGALLSFSIFP